MNVTPFPAKLPNASSGRSSRLDEIASILGVSVDTLSEPSRSHVFHADDEGTRWALTFDSQGVLSVECNNYSSGQGAIKESVSSFFSHDIGSPQYQSLMAFIERLILVHLGG